MREITITDGELQKMIGEGIRRRLRAAGFVLGTSERDISRTYLFPINLDLTGAVEVFRHEDGVWTIRQDETAIAAMINESDHMLGEAVLRRTLPLQS